MSLTLTRNSIYFTLITLISFVVLRMWENSLCAEKSGTSAQNSTAVETSLPTSWLRVPALKVETEPVEAKSHSTTYDIMLAAFTEESSQRLPPLTPQEQQVVNELPPACQSGLPGIDLTPRMASNMQRLPSVAPLSEEHRPNSVTEMFALPSVTTDQMMLSPEKMQRYNPHAKASRALQTIKTQASLQPMSGNCDPHASVFEKDLYPSATECKSCHQQIYDEWAVSNHAYAGLSPMFHKFEQKLQALAQGTLGYFCYRCHAPVATIMGHAREKAVYDGPRVFREGVTCVVCHRVAEHYTKANGERRLEPGGLNAPTYGKGDGLGVELALKYKDQYKLKTDPADTKAPGQVIHNRVIQFEEISKSTFCLSCHQVAVHPNIKLEVVWEQYRNSPAYRQGIRCHDCHMGKVPGLNQGFDVSNVAVINDKPFGTEKRHSNHLFYGPGYSIAHPGLFPHHPKADRWTPQQWLAFDWRSEWGTEAFETQVENGQIQPYFPPEWSDGEDRRDAREILNANFKRLAYKDETRQVVMENGSRIDGPFFSCETQCSPGVYKANADLKLHYLVTNLNSGHNMPTASLGAQPQMWLNAVLVNPAGQRVWETGYLDTQADLADIHSIDVQKGRVPFDRQLVNYQTKFLITNIKGTDREMPLPVNIDIDQLPYLRPGTQPITVLNHPPFIRMEAHSIAPLGVRPANYKIPASALQMPGVYRLSIRMRCRAEPMYFMKFVECTDEMMRRMTEKILDVHPYTITFEIR